MSLYVKKETMEVGAVSVSYCEYGLALSSVGDVCTASDVLSITLKAV